ncbi:MAG: response regulator transcription factor [Burkholderiales bacterium]|nr:response regulator transcription factor [Burkholderiales bacterium]
MDSITVLIADDHAPFRAAVRDQLAQAPGIRVVGEAKDGDEAVAQARALAPSVVLIDVHMPNLGGIPATREIAGSMPNVRVIALSQYDEPAIVEAMRAAGAADYVLKDELYEKLVPAIRAAVTGRRG